MEQRTLGKTGLSIYPIGLGASALGGGVFGEVDEVEAVRTVHLALDLGVQLIDTSPFYGATRAETVLGKALRGIPRDNYILATKVGRYGDAEFDFSAERTRQSIDESLKRLGVSYVDLIQAHDVEYGDFRQVQNETVPTLRDVVREGKARFVGLTGYPLKALSSLVAKAEVDTVLSYNHYSLNDTTLLSALPEFESRRLGVINAAPLSQGLLTDNGTPPWHLAPASIKALCAETAEFVRARGSSISKLAVQFSTRNPAIATTLIGTAIPAELERNLRWADEPIDTELLRLVQEKLAPVKDITWTTGRPENN